jgi:hypothetical protein
VVSWGGIAGVQVFVVGVVLCGAGLGKIIWPPDRNGPRKTALSRLLNSPDRLRFVWRFVSTAQVAIGSLCLTLPVERWPEAGALVLLIGATIYVSWALRSAPHLDCGCLGLPSKLGRRSLARISLLLIAASASVMFPQPWIGAVVNPLGGAVALGEIVMVGSLGDEWRAVLAPTRHVITRWRSSLVGRKAVLAVLHRSQLWERWRPYLTGTFPTEQWRDGCWHFLCFPATVQDRQATAVFAVHLPSARPLVRAALVGEDAGLAAAPTIYIVDVHRPDAVRNQGSESEVRSFPALRGDGA